MGSSPRARGAPGSGTGGLPIRRLIPASAGSTSPARPSAASARAHPRERGEHREQGFKINRIQGSSPRARGALGEPVADELADRLIPASAGSTNRPTRTCGAQWAHPRERGEHFNAVRARIYGGGSSPRARGARIHHPGGATGPGLIPASAGSTRAPPARWRPTPAHPRERGEHWLPPGGPDLDAAHPRERGEHRCRCSPTLATRRAHPRERGEHAGNLTVLPFRSGSSPRARGARLLSRQQRGGGGLIPASAGSTGTAGSAGRRWRAHPRERGEH